MNDVDIHMPPNTPSDIAPADLSPPQIPVPTMPSPEVVLSDEQKAILTLVRAGRSVFFTGSAGNVFALLAASLYSDTC